jgi:hypothetical protein
MIPPSLTTSLVQKIVAAFVMTIVLMLLMALFPSAAVFIFVNVVWAVVFVLLTVAILKDGK